MTSDTAWACLAWQVELGADEAIGDTPVDRFETAMEEGADPPAAATSEARPLRSAVYASPDPLAAPALAERVSAAAGTLPQLREALAGFDACDLRHGARNLVFSDGDPAARVMIVGEAPGRDEDRIGKPFVGRAGQLLDAMFGAIGLSRDAEDAARALYITNMLPWRPPQNRDPTPEEISMLQPFVRRHVELADPEVVVLMGNWACVGLLGRKGITRLRGTWEEVLGRPALPMFHPAFLLRQPVEKARAWADLLSLKARLQGRT